MAKLFTVTSADYQELSLFLADFYPETESPTSWQNNFRFWWDDNPAFSSDFERGWMLRENERIVGFLGSIPTCFQLFGQTIVVFNATTWRVLPEARNQSMNLFYKLLSASKHSILFNTTPNEEVIQILKALKFQLIPGLEDYHRSLITVNTEKVLASRLGAGLGRKMVAKFLAPSLTMVQLFRLKNLKEPERITVKQVTEADASFDQLWARTKDLYPNTNIRTAEVINWYCFKNKALKKIAFGCYKENHLCGYAIFETRFNQRNNLKLFECLDLWFDPAESDIVNSLVPPVRSYARQNAIDLISFPHFNNHIASYLKQLGLFQMKFEGNKYLKASPTLVHGLIPKESYFVGLQGDTGLA